MFSKNSNLKENLQKDTQSEAPDFLEGTEKKERKQEEEVEKETSFLKNEKEDSPSLAGSSPETVAQSKEKNEESREIPPSPEVKPLIVSDPPLEIESISFLKNEPTSSPAEEIEPKEEEKPKATFLKEPKELEEEPKEEELPKEELPKEEVLPKEELPKKKQTAEIFSEKEERDFWELPPKS